MIVSHAHKFIFFAVPRTGTHALRNALNGYLTEDDWQQQFLFGEQKIPIPALAQIPHGHISLQQVQTHLPEDIWRSYFKFAFVRNPFDRYVSVCSFLNRGQSDFDERASQFMERALQVGRFRQRILVRPQSDMLVNSEGYLQMDFIGHYETLQQDFDRICEQLNLQKQQLVKNNASVHRSFRQYYQTPTLTQIVSLFYQRDFQLFNYSLNPHET